MTEEHKNTVQTEIQTEVQTEVQTEGWKDGGVASRLVGGQQVSFEGCKTGGGVVRGRCCQWGGASSLTFLVVPQLCGRRVEGAVVVGFWGEKQQQASGTNQQQWALLKGQRTDVRQDCVCWHWLEELKAVRTQRRPLLVGQPRFQSSWEQQSGVDWVNWGGLVTSQQALDGQQDGAHVVERRPLVLQDVQADEALVVHVGVEARGEELDPRGLVGVSGRELQGESVPEARVHLVVVVGTGGGSLESDGPGTRNWSTTSQQQHPHWRE